MERLKKFAVVAVFGLLIFGLAIAHWVLPDQKLSSSERRALASAPKLSWEKVKNGDFFEDSEEYLLDQFPMRDSFRTLKAVTNRNVFAMKDSGRYFKAQGHLSQLSDPLKPEQVNLSIAKFNQILQEHPEIRNAYISLIPDKNYFLAAPNGYPAMDYETMFRMVQEGVEARYIDITGLLSLDKYYTTDTHWRQEAIVPVAQALAQAMGAPVTPEEAYTPHTMGPFHGVYSGHSAIPAKPDTMIYLTTPATDGAHVQSLEHKEPMPVYPPEDFEAVDPYDLFLSGAEALITMENPRGQGELVIFRDSFGSSLSPLLLDSYAKITLVDLRYFSSALLLPQEGREPMVNFEGADVLFLYSTTLINSGSLLK